MKKLILFGLFLTSGSALAFDGTPRLDWLGKPITTTPLPFNQQPLTA